MSERLLRWLTDENLPLPIAEWLHARGHDVVRVEGSLLSAPDDVLLAQAHLADRLLLTNDKDFLLLRMPTLSMTEQIVRLESVWPEVADQLVGSFVVISAKRARVERLSGPLE